MIGAVLKRCSDIENEIANRSRPRDAVDRIELARLGKERERRLRHARDLFWHLARSAGPDPDWAKWGWGAFRS
jgi:hypothetical protein